MKKRVKFYTLIFCSFFLFLPLAAFALTPEERAACCCVCKDWNSIGSGGSEEYCKNNIAASECKSTSVGGVGGSSGTNCTVVNSSACNDAPAPTAIEQFVDPSQFTPILKVKIGPNVLTFDQVNCDPGKSCDIGWISKYIGIVYQYGVGLAAILAAIMILIGGFVWLLSAGSPDRVKTAKELIVGALSGLALALLSYVMLATVNPKLVSNSPVQITSVKVLPGFGAGASEEVSAGGGGGAPAAKSGDKWDSLNQQTKDKVNEYEQHGCDWTSGYRSTGRHSSGQVVDFGKNSECDQYVTDNVDKSVPNNPHDITWGKVYKLKDGSYWVDENIAVTGGTGPHWHVEIPGNGWEWKEAR